MRTFQKKTQNNKTTPVADMSIDLETVKQIRLGVYANRDRAPVADVIIKYTDDTTVNLKNNLSKWQNVFYRLPPGS